MKPNVSSEDAVTAALRKYRQMYPLGVIAPELEDQAVLSVLPGVAAHRVSVTFGIVDEKSPFVFVQAVVDANTGEVKVTTAENASILSTLDLDNDTYCK